MKKTDFIKHLDSIVPQLTKGAFILSGDNANPMTIGWASFGIVWGKPICTVFVRHSRYTHKLMDENNTFTVSFPCGDEMKKELSYCGSKSGRDHDKLAELNLSVTDTDMGGKLLGGCTVHIVCKTVAKTEMDMENVSAEILDKYYNKNNQATLDGDPHTIYFGEIIETWCD